MQIAYRIFRLGCVDKFRLLPPHSKYCGRTEGNDLWLEKSRETIICWQNNKIDIVAPILET